MESLQGSLSKGYPGTGESSVDFSTPQGGQLEEETFSSIFIAREKTIGPCSVVFSALQFFHWQNQKRGDPAQNSHVIFKDLFKARLFHKSGLQWQTIPSVWLATSIYMVAQVCKGNYLYEHLDFLRNFPTDFLVVGSEILLTKICVMWGREGCLLAGQVPHRVLLVPNWIGIASSSFHWSMSGT